MSEQNWAEVKAAAERIEKLVHDMRTKHEGEVKELGAARDETKENLKTAVVALGEMKQRLDAIETKMSRPGFSDNPPAPRLSEKAVFYKAMCGRQLTEPEQKIHTEMQRKASLLSDNRSGGFLAAPPEVVDGILENTQEFSPVRELADVRSGNAESMTQDRQTADFSASYVGETATRTETTGYEFGVERIFAHEMFAEIRISRQNLDDSGHDLESHFNRKAGQAFGVREGRAFISGDSVGQPEGILTNTNIGSTTAANTDAILGDEFIDVFYSIKQPYRDRGSWLVNRLIISEIMQLKTGDSQYIWRPGLQPGQPDVLLNRPVLDATDLGAALTTGLHMAIFGEVAAGYRVYDRKGMTVLVDPFSGKATGMVHFQFYRRGGGGVILPEALARYTLL